MPITGPEPGCGDAAGVWNARPVTTPRLRLRPLSESDVPTLVDLAGEWEVARYTAFIPHPFAEADARAFLARVAGRIVAGNGVTFAIDRRDRAGLIGVVDAILKDDGKAEIGYWIGKPHWGQGYASEALAYALPVFFDSLETETFVATVRIENAASARVLEKAGFVSRGRTIGCHGRCAGEEIDVFELTRDDWNAAWVARPRVLVVAVGLIDVDGRVLVQQRPQGTDMAGLWEFPGGKVRDDETPEAALVRELNEELGIDTAESCLAPFAFASHAYAAFHLLMPLYLCRTWKGELTGREGQALKWVRPNMLRDYPMPPADEPLVALLRDYL